ncbi:MAG: DNA polymerase I [Desulfovibrio sp.]|jgi:DNA polymerase-1|nr:DNA polymerase I [Desulfovibrio sp.]
MPLRSRLGFTAEPLYLMDGSAFIFRSFYAFRNMSRSDGFPTNVMHMVTRLILRLLREEKPVYFGVIMDGKAPTFRQELFPAYKGNRSATPEDLIAQINPLRELLGMLGVPVIVSHGCEADDCIASLAGRHRDGQPVIILGADKDLKQCLHENVVLWNPAAKDEHLATLADFRTETGMEPCSWPDCQALMGDASDNIPGIPKIGPKTALELIREFATLEGIFSNLSAIDPKTRVKLEGQREKALLYRELTRLRNDVCPALSLADMTIRPVALEAALRFMAAYELRALGRELESMSRAGLLRRPHNTPITNEEPPPLSPPSPSVAVSRETATRDAPPADSDNTPSRKTPSSNAKAQQAAGRNVQESLFADLALSASSFPKVFSPRELPLNLSAELEPTAASPGALALLPLDQDMLLATQEHEIRYAGSMEKLAPILARLCAPGRDPACLLVTPDMKALYKDHIALRSLPPSSFFDLSLATYLLNPEDRAYSWEQEAARWGERAGSTYSANEHPGFLALELRRFMAEQLAGAGLGKIFSELELPLVPVLARMEERGMGIDPAAFFAFLAETQRDLEHLTTHIHSLAGRVFNIRSSQQLSDVLFSVLNLPKAGKTKGGATSTSQENLEKLTGKHPVVDAILDYRKLEKLRSTYLEPLPRLADPSGRIHTTFNQKATATGRLSSSNPNLQNIPVRGPVGQRMRACFTAAPGMAIISADYSQIELRVLAHLSGDPTLTDAFLNNEDIHSRTASLLFDAPLGEVTPDQRRSAKTINFGLIYGMGAQKLAQELRVPLKEAKEFIERYFARLSRLKEFYDAIEEEARRHGFVSTMIGRRRLIPDILSENAQLRAHARRQAINTRIQGSAADIIKLAMLAVENDQELHSLDARLLLQIHDELLLEAPQGNAEAAGLRLVGLMSNVRPGSSSLTVPLLVNWGAGANWAEAH